MSRVKGRTDDMIMIHGAKLFPSQIHDVVLGTAGITPLCIIVLDRKNGMDTLEIRVAIDSNSDFIDEIKTLEKLRTTLASGLQTSFGVTAGVTFMEEGLMRNETSGKKQPLVIDKR
jgi:phenylacetate-CoA ligase